MAKPHKPSLDHLSIFLKIAESGSFASAARELGKAPSAITYAIEQLENLLGLALFERGTARRPVLTQFGEAMLVEARMVCRAVDNLQSRISAIQAGIEVELSLAVDIMFPRDRLIPALRAFQKEFPAVPLRLYVEGLGGPVQQVLDGKADLAIAGPSSRAVQGLHHYDLGYENLIPVAAPDHPLAAMTQPVEPGEASNHIQLVLVDRTPITRGVNFGVVGIRTWRLADMGAKYALLLSGIGWGTMPEFMVRADLDSGKLVELTLPDRPRSFYAFSAIHLADRSPGPAARWLIDTLAG